jgi:hypothetical protein
MANSLSGDMKDEKDEGPSTEVPPVDRGFLSVEGSGKCVACEYRRDRQRAEEDLHDLFNFV